MPVRKIPRSHRNVTGVLAAAKADGQAQFESTLERDFLALLEFAPDVQAFEVQPVEIYWKDGDQQRRYTPDVLVKYKRADRRPELCEVKYRSELREQWPALRPKFKAGLRYARGRGWRFRIVTEVEIRTPLLANVQFLQRFVRQGPPPADDMDLVDRSMVRLQEAEAQRLLQDACSDEWTRARLLPALWYLVGTHQIGADLEKPLTMKTALWSKA
jgi:hypothetical protein